MNIIDYIINDFNKKPYLINMGSGKLSYMYSKKLKEVVLKADIYKARQIIRQKHYNENLPKILVFDIETSPSISYTFGRFKYNIMWDQVEQEPIMLTWAAKWLYSDDVLSDKITSEEVLNEDDSRIVKSLWDLMETADIVVAHYGDNFDLPMLNTRAILNGLPPYSTVRSIDTKKVASTVFNFPSNKLDALAKYFGLKGKIKTEFQLWINCLKGKSQAIKEMETYNKQDVLLLEEVYLLLRPYIKSHPNVGAYMDNDTRVCSVCGSTHLTETNKYQYTNTGKYKLWRCECGALSRGRRTDFDKTTGKNLLTSVPR